MDPWTSSGRRVACLGALLVTTGCFTPVEETYPSADAGPELRSGPEQRAWTLWSSAEAQRCQSAADCVAVDVTCCPCSAGGTEVAVNRSAAAELRAILADCDGFRTCKLSDQCHRQAPSCPDGRCGFVVDGP